MARGMDLRHARPVGVGPGASDQADVTFTYTLGDLSRVEKDLGGATIADMAFSYNPDGTIDTIVDSVNVWTKTFAYSGGNLATITVT